MEKIYIVYISNDMDHDMQFYSNILYIIMQILCMIKQSSD